MGKIQHRASIADTLQDCPWKAEMRTAPEPPIDTDLERFRRFRFDTFRQFSIRLGFCVALIFLLTFIPDWMMQRSKVVIWLPLRIFIGFALISYPIAILWGVSRKMLPWLLYVTVIFSMLIRLASELPKDRNGFDNIWMAFYFFFIAFILGLPLRRRDNVIGIIALVVIPNLLGLFQSELIPSIVRFDLMVLPLAAFLIFVQYHLNKLLETLYTYQNQIRALAHRDSLTGLFNRRHFMEAADLMVKRAKRSHHPISVLILDIDHFKNINDRFGHPVGDLVIKETARALAGAFRETDLVARLGGEEFVAMLADSDRVAGVQAAERVRRALETTEVVVAGFPEPVRFTASLGVTMMKAEGETVDALLERADLGLYVAKRGGRNRVEFQELCESDGSQGAVRTNPEQPIMGNS